MSYDQVFCKSIDLEILYGFFDKITYKKNDTYLIDYNAYKKLVFHNLQTELCEQLKPYYYKSKHYYLERDLTYNSFTTIIRQVCKFNSIKIVPRVRYIESLYMNEYTVFTT